MKIEKIIKKTNNKYILELDNGDKIKTYDEVILKYGILFHKEIDDATLEQLIKENNYYDAYNKVLKYISTKMRSEKEIEVYLDKIEYPNKKELIEKLKSQKLIDDSLFVKAYVNDKILLTLDGPYKIKKSLEDNEIDVNLINEALSVFDSKLIKERLDKIISKKIKTNKKSLYVFKQKMTSYLLNLGYDKENINEVLNNYHVNEEELIKKDYEIIKKKLQNKYDGDKLNYQIKQKLYQKGYSIEAINSIIS